MKQLPDIKQLDTEAKDALIVALWEEVQKLRQLVKKPKKTSKNSSLPPAKGFKAQVKSKDKASEVKRAGSIGREGGGRPLSEHPDQIITAKINSCQGCGTNLSSSLQQLIQRYEKIDIPPIQPVVTKVERSSCTCPECGQQQIAPVPVGMEPGSPFGPRIAALVTTMRYAHGISYNRMQQMLGEVFGLEISEGAIANLLLRVKEQLQSSVDGIVQRLRSSRLHRELSQALTLLPIQADGVRLQNRYRDLREHLFLFLEDSAIPPTNNSSEQALRWSVIFRKVTNGFRSDWGRDLFAAVRSIVNTGKRQGLSAFESILTALNPLESLFPLS